MNPTHRYVDSGVSCVSNSQLKLYDSSPDYLLCFLKEHTFAALPRTQRGRRLCIKGDPKGKYMLYSHNKGVIIRDVEVFSSMSLVYHFANKRVSLEI
jgi:hypothetical protein